jgi:thiamine transport system substrate-binding protein
MTMTHVRFGWLAALLILSVWLPVAAQEDTVTLVTYDSFALSEGVQEAFEEETGFRLEIVRLADAGTMLNQVILSRANPLGDVLYGVDNTFLSRALEAEIFTPYEPEAAEAIDPAFVMEGFTVTPVAYGDVCLNYDAAFFAANDLAVPESLDDLTAPDYESLLVVQNPASSSPGLAFLLTTIAVFGEGDDYDYLDYWADLAANDVLIVDGWTEAYYGEFSAASEDGDRPLVVSYASSPPVEVLFMETEPETAPTGAIVADDTCFRQVEYAGILEGADNPEGAQQLIDFLVSRPFQEDLPLQMFVFPVSTEAELPELFVEYAAVPENPVTFSYEAIDANRERWLDEWTEAVIR